MGLFTTVDVIGQGLPLFTPKGTKMIMKLQRWIEDLEDNDWGYVRTRTPLMAKSDLYKISGHWDHYKDGMFVLGDEEHDKEVFALRPMTCPFQYYVYKNEQHSYRDLPYRMSETSTLFRCEDSGEMHGLTRVRQFTISEAHLVIRPDQAEEELKRCFDLSYYVLSVLGLEGDVTYRLSKWDPANKKKYLGDDEYWNRTQEALREVLREKGVDFVEADGEAAFYGPKLDVNVKPAVGNEYTLSTCQLDFCLPAKFNLTYVDKDGQKKTPVVLHRAILGSLDRFMAYILEETKGNLPLWLAPVQAMILPVKNDDEELNAYAHDLYGYLLDNNIRADIDERAEKLGYRVREAQVKKIPYLIILGKQEAQDGTVSYRLHGQQNTTTVSRDEFLAMLKDEIATKKLSK